MPPLTSSVPPYALAPNHFRFPALATLAGRAALGGRREVALAVYLGARLAHDALPDRGVAPSVRAGRTTNARTWLANLALPQQVRPALAKLMDASSGTPSSAAEAVRVVIAVTADFLDHNARLELDRLAASLERQALAG